MPRQKNLASISEKASWLAENMAEEIRHYDWGLDRHVLEFHRRTGRIFKAMQGAGLYSQATPIWNVNLSRPIRDAQRILREKPDRAGGSE